MPRKSKKLLKSAFNDLVMALLQYQEAGGEVKAGKWYEHSYIRLPGVRYDKDSKKLELMDDKRQNYIIYTHWCDTHAGMFVGNGGGKMKAINLKSMCDHLYPFKQQWITEWLNHIIWVRAWIAVNDKTFETHYNIYLRLTDETDN